MNNGVECGSEDQDLASYLLDTNVRHEMTVSHASRS